MQSTTSPLGMGISALATARTMLLKSISIVQFAVSNFCFPLLASGYQKKTL